MGKYELLIRGGDVVFPGNRVQQVDIGIRDGMIVALGVGLEPDADEVLDASGKLVFPGVVDSHFHMGIFRPLAEDAVTESASAIAGGVTTALIYYRAGRNNLLLDTEASLPSPYTSVLPDLLGAASGNFFCDYGFNLAPVTTGHVQELPTLVAEGGVTTFKYYMHYRGTRPDAPPPKDEKEFVFTDSGYDLGHLHSIMVQIAEVNRGGVPVRLSIHAEHPAIIRENSEDTKRRLSELPDNPLQLYSRSRPPSGERLGILIAAELADQTGCPINILHVSSSEALEAIREVRGRYRNLDVLAEATVHHLTLSNEEHAGVDAKVNPPIRSSADREALWAAVADGLVETIVSDHAAITSDRKGSDIWTAWYGFGGTELLLPAILTEGHLQRNIPLENLATLLSAAPARYHGLHNRKGDIAVGYDADLVICDLTSRREVDHTTLHSAQDFSPFDGMSLAGWAETTILRGSVVYRDGDFGPRTGRYLSRPY